jgi:hypothetical protein
MVWALLTFSYLWTGGMVLYIGGSKANPTELLRED